MVLIRKILFIFLILFGTAKSCNVPVFRYALERWTSDVYQVFVFAEGSDKGQAFQLLAENAVGKDSLSNYSLTTVDVNTEDGKKAAEANEIAEFPWMAVYYPTNSQVQGLVWEGLLTKENAERLIHSPVRNQAAEQILGGDAAVWVFLKSGNEEKDKTALAVLKKTLAKASNELKIPNTGTDIDGNEIEVTDFEDYDVKFDVIELSRDDPKEIMLLAMLLGSESDLVYYDEPMTFPVFGRGRSLYAIIGKGINEKTVYNACRSIIAWCSCEVKEQNPGIDLLISADWSNPVGGQMVEDEELPPLTGLSEFIPQEEEKPQPVAKVVEKEEIEKVEPAKIDTVKAEPIIKDMIKTINVEPKQTSNSLLRNLLLVAGLGLVVIVVTTIILKSKK